MFIKNIERYSQEELFKCNKVIADWLVLHKIPILSIAGKIYYFHESVELEIALSKLPFYLKPFLHVPKAFQ